MSQEDRAQDQEIMDWERYNKVRSRKTYNPTDAGYGPEWCDECGAVMPELRRTDGRRLCTACQTVQEKQRR